MNSSPKRRNSVSQRINAWESYAASLGRNQPRHRRSPPPQEDDDNSIQGLTPAQIDVLAQKVYDLLLDELRIDAERRGVRGF